MHVEQLFSYGDTVNLKMFSYTRIGRKAPEIDDENIREIFYLILTGFSTKSNRRKYTSSGSFTANGILHDNAP
jgi:hypothetical protein